MPIDQVIPFVLGLARQSKRLDEEGDLELGIGAVNRLRRDAARRRGKDQSTIAERAFDHLDCEGWRIAAAYLQRDSITVDTRGRTHIDDFRFGNRAVWHNSEIPPSGT